MNDEDKEAFGKWFEDYRKGGSIHDHMKEAWKVACEYKQKEIEDKYTEDITYLDEKIKKLQAENAKLRECVEKVAYSYDRPTDMMNSARQVLKELEE